MNIFSYKVKVKITIITMKQSKNQLNKIGEQEIEPMENTTKKEQDYNHIQVLQNHIQKRIKGLSGQ